MSRSTHSRVEDRIKTLKRRRDYLYRRIADYQGKDASRDKAEASALHWALAVIEANYQSAYDIANNEHRSTDNITKEDI